MPRKLNNSDRAKNISASKRKNRVGKKYGKLTVVKLDENNTQNWICICECGTEKSIYRKNLDRGDTNSCGCFRREHSRKLLNSLHIKAQIEGGYEGFKDSYLKNRERRLSRLENSSIKKRDCNSCILCAVSGQECQLHVHHIETFISSPELRSCHKNLVSLCKTCHLKVHMGNWTNNKTDWFLTGILRAYTEYIENKEDLCQLDLSVLLK